MTIDENALPHFYEGTEKLLEVWFEPDLDQKNEKSEKPADLRTIPRCELDELLTGVGATIISSMSAPDTDAYVLSESSLFVSKDRVILKTCGNTRLISAIRPLTNLVQKYTAFRAVKDLFYSRKDFLRPELQTMPHQAFTQEVRVLDEDFNGSAYCLGRVNDQCWYLYVLENDGKEPRADQCLEIIMEKLDPEVMKMFTQASSGSALEATQKSGIDMIIPKAQIDDFLFNPCGYSMNGLVAGQKGYYLTIHITPEQSFSYVSFETNFVPKCYGDLIRRVLKVFRPGKFLFSIYTTKKSAGRILQLDLEESLDFEKYKRMDWQTYSLRNYLLSYLSFVQDIT